jgi:heme-degrading monooxygenase HmoA
MAIVAIAHHRVRDFDTWKRVYDSVSELQKAGGVRQHAVMRVVDDPDMVVVVHTFDSAEAAHAFLSNPELGEAMQSAGVDLSTFSYELSDEVSRGTY